MSVLFAIIYLLGAGQGAFLSIQLFLRPENRRANRLLAVLLGIFALNLFELFLEEMGYYRLFPHMLWSFTSAPFLYGPLIFLYAGTLTGRFTRFKAIYLLNFVPFFLHFATILPFYLKTGDFKIAAYDHYLVSGFPTTFKPLFTYSLKLLHYGLYLGLTLGLIARYRREMEEQYSELERLDLGWLKLLAIVNLAMIGIFIATVTGHGLEIITMTHGITRISYLWDTALIYTVGILAVRQAPIFNEYRRIIEPVEPPTPQPGEPPDGRTPSAPTDAVQQTKVKYEKSRLDDHIADAYLAELTTHMRTAKPYLNSELGIKELATAIGLTEHVLSQVVNGRAGMNFFTFVNNFRIEEAQRLLADPSRKEENILAAAFESGFKSKSHFNTLFKKTTGLTPREFRRQKVGR